MNVTIEKCGDELIAALAGEIDHHNSKQIREAIDAELERGGYKLLTFDLESVSFMDSSGIGMILGRYRRMSSQECGMAIVGCSKSIRNILNMAGVFSIIDYYNTKEEAIEGFNRKEVS